MGTKGSKINIDLSDQAKLVELLRLHSVRSGTTQKAIIIEALQAYFSAKQEDLALLKTAEEIFSEWQSPEDKIYDSL